MGWGVADQGMSSLTNFAVNIYIARELGAVEYGAFALAFVTYAFALNVSPWPRHRSAARQVQRHRPPDLAPRRSQVRAGRPQ